MNVQASCVLCCLLLLSAALPATAAGDPPSTPRSRVQGVKDGASAASEVTGAANAAHGIYRSVQVPGAGVIPYTSAFHGAAAADAAAVARTGRQLGNVAHNVGSIATGLEVGAVTYDTLTCATDGANCWEAAAGALDTSSQFIADRTPMGAIVSRGIRVADQAYQYVDPKGRTAMGAFVEGAVAPVVAPYLGFEYVAEWDSYATHAQAAQFRHTEQVEQIRVAREMREAFDPVYTPRDGGSEFDPLAAFLGGIATAASGCADPTGASCGAVAAPTAAAAQANECDHPGHDPVAHTCDASGRSITGGGSAQ